MAPKAKVLVFPLAAAGNTHLSSSNRLARGLTEYVQERLDRLPGVEVLTQKLLLSAEGPDGPIEAPMPGAVWTLEQIVEMPIPGELGATHVLHGAMRRDRGQWQLDLQLVELEASMAQWEQRIGRGEQEFPAELRIAMLDLARQLVGEMPEHALKSPLDPPTRLAASFEPYLMALGHLAAARLPAYPRQALECMLQAIEADPTNIECAERLNGLLLYFLWEDKSHEAEAISVLRRAVETLPAYAPFHGSLGMWMASHGNVTAGQRVLEQYLTLETDRQGRSRGLSILGTLHRSQGRRGDAAKLFEEAVLLDEENINAWGELAACHAEEQRLHEAKRCLRKVLDLDPEHTGALMNLGNLLWNEDDRDRSLILFERALATGRDRDPVRMRLVQAYLAAGRVADANDIATDWAEASDTQAMPWLLLARTRRTLGELRAARFALDQARRLATAEPERLELEMEEFALASPGDHDLFRTTLEAELAALPPALRDRGRFLQAVAEARPVLTTEEGMARLDAFSGLADRHRGVTPLWLVLAEARLRRGLYSAAAEAQRHVVEALPLNPAQWSSLGVLLAQSSQRVEALDAFEKACGLAPKAPQFRSNYALCLKELGQEERAEGEFRKVLALDPNEPVARKELGEMEERRRARELAAHEAQAALPSPPAGLVGRLAAALESLARWAREKAG
ncbi:MAG: tetratricopeptide repeat protein [Candidatus Sumerlaeia bacterium]|nr:tetratricopeptide repeat protein [Candidatus Sumerlaeia bacterium]